MSSLMSFGVFLITVIVLINQTQSFPSKTGHCPLPGTLKICLPKCYSDYECSGVKVCCPNNCGTSSCTEPKPVSHNDDKHDKVVMCANVKCLPSQVCKTDSKTKRSKCVYP